MVGCSSYRYLEEGDFDTGKLGKNSKSSAENLTHDPPSSSSDALAMISMPVIEVYMRILM